MRHRLILYFATFIMATVGFLIVDYSLRKEYLTKRLQPQREVQPVVLQSAEPVIDVGQQIQFLNRFKNIARQIEAVSDDPESSEELLNNFSTTIKPSDSIVLNGVLIDSNNKNFERSLALELLIAHQDFQSHNFLYEFIQDEQKMGVGRAAEFEIALRSQAIEGLTLYSDKKLVRKNLENLKIRTKYAVFFDRADRALSYVNGSTTPSEMDSFDAQAVKR